jgi:flotillin
MLSDLGNQALSWVMPLMIISSLGFLAYQAF